MKSFISDLSDGAQVDLVAIMWMGRAEGPDSWTEAKELAFSQQNDRTAEYLVGTPPMPDHLKDGLAAIGRSCSEYEEDDV